MNLKQEWKKDKEFVVVFVIFILFVLASVIGFSVIIYRGLKSAYREPEIRVISTDEVNAK